MLRTFYMRERIGYVWSFCEVAPNFDFDSSLQFDTFCRVYIKKVNLSFVTDQNFPPEKNGSKQFKTNFFTIEQYLVTRERLHVFYHIISHLLTHIRKVIVFHHSANNHQHATLLSRP